MKTYEDFNLSNLFSKKKKNPLIDIINKNIKRSKDEFGLNIRKEDIELETIVIMSVFSQYDFKKSSQYSDSEYTKLYRNILKEICDRLEHQLRYYFNNTPEGGVKSRYNCHLQSVITDLMRNVTSTNEGVKWYSNGKLTSDPNSVIEYDDFIPDDDFRNFLIDKGCYDEFIMYVKSDFKNDFKKYDRRTYIDKALRWSSTKSGNEYWGRLHKEWKDIVNNNKFR